jgi:hypothetical protein
MSWVTDVLVLCSVEERFASGDFTPGSCPPPIKEINAWLGRGDHGELVSLDQHAIRGGKAFQAVVFGGAFNHFPLADFLKVVYAQEWAAPGLVQILTKDEEEQAFVLHNLEK